MCGIVGAIEPDRPSSERHLTLRRMAAAIVHRGPDDEGYFVDGPVSIGMRRLSIIDLEGGHQPIHNEDGSVVTVFNGEIYNYRELRSDLIDRGHCFGTDSDTETIVHCYEEYGDGFVDHLRGMFGLAVWDTRRQRLLLARDRLGVKPLYYAQIGGKLVFASEVKALLQHPDIVARASFPAIADYLALKYVPAPDTMFDGIRSLPPGHVLVWEGGQIEIRCYWDLSFRVDAESGPKNEDEAAERLDELLRESVRLRLRSDVPFGALLSGGVDSSTIVALMSRMLNEPVKTFSVGFESVGGSQDELPYARMVARRFGTDHHEIVVRPHDLLQLAEQVTWSLDQPIADQATFAAYAVSELASRHVKMVLTGEGGDELFAGYARYQGERWANWFRWLPTPMRSLAWKIGCKLPRRRRAKIALYALCQRDEASRHANWFPLFNRDAREALLHEAWRDRVDPRSHEIAFAEHLARTDASHSLHRMLYVDTKLWLPDFLLLRGDKMSMAHSLEGRVPLLDHRVAEFAASLPPEMKLRGRTRKYLLKKVARRYLPAEIVDRKKRGFPIPISAWFRHEAREYVRDLLSPNTIRRRGLLDEVNVGRLLVEHESGFADHGLLLWGLISLELWHRLYIDSPPTRDGVEMGMDSSAQRTADRAAAPVMD